MTNLEKLTAYINTKPNRKQIFNALKAIASMSEPDAQKINDAPHKDNVLFGQLSPFSDEPEHGEDFPHTLH